MTVGTGHSQAPDKNIVLGYGQDYRLTFANSETYRIQTSSTGAVQVDRELGHQFSQTNFDASGLVTAKMVQTNSNGTQGTQTDVIDGKQSKIIEETYQQTLPDGYRVDAERDLEEQDLKVNGDVAANAAPMRPAAPIESSAEATVDQAADELPTSTFLQQTQIYSRPTKHDQSRLETAKTTTSQARPPLVHNQVATLDQTVDQQTIYIGVRTQLNPSFNEGVPLVAPTTFGSGGDQLPDNHFSATNNNVIRSMKTKFKLTKQRRLIKEATWKNGGEHIMFATKNVNKEIEAVRMTRIFTSIPFKVTIAFRIRWVRAISGTPSRMIQSEIDCRL